MMETDIDRLECIRALGGVSVSVDGGSFEAIFDREYAAGVDIESRSPALTARDTDVARLRIKKNAVVNVSDEVYKVRRLEPDGTGMTVLILDL